MSIDLKHFKNKLEEEQKTVEAELAEVGRKNPDNPSDWEAVSPEGARSHADDNLTADEMEEYDNNLAVVTTLEKRANDIKAALDRIEDGTYGVCTVGGEEISEERLEANPSAATCKEHMQ